MKYVVINKIAPGVENARQSIEAFKEAGMPEGTESLWASIDGKTFINVIDTDQPDTVMMYTYAPSFEETTVFEVVPVDDSWHQAIQQAQSYWD